MPCARFEARLERTARKVREEDEEDLRRWMIGLWAQSRALYHALTANNDLPQTRADQKRSVSDAQLERAKKARIEHDEAWLRAITSPKHFGAFLGMPSILGEPEDEPAESTKGADGPSGALATAKRVLKSVFG